MTVTWDPRLSDEDVLDEIQMTSDLIIAASQSTTSLDQANIDRILGLTD